jgi:tRNA G10  N-methylase Trm11
MIYLFILGRNPQLSVAEIKGFLKRTGNVIMNEKLRENGLLIELEKPLDAGTVDILGGTIAIGVVMCQLKDMNKREIYFGTDNKFNYAIWDFSDRTEEVSQYLKVRFRSERLKVTEKKFSGFIKTQDENIVKKLSSHLINEEFFVYENLFGKIVQKCNYKELEKRDMEKPVRREDLSISPRLAKIMINLSEVKEDGNLLDGFCGVGVILMEALNMGIKVVGIDKDKEAIEGARKNLQWTKIPTDKYLLMNNDSSKVVMGSMDVLVSEPDFGETLRKAPSQREAEHMIKQYEGLIISVLNNIKKSVLGKFVLTFPYISLGRERIGCDLPRICEKTGLKMEEGFPIKEFREGQIVGREIVVLKK